VVITFYITLFARKSNYCVENLIICYTQPMNWIFYILGAILLVIIVVMTANGWWRYVLTGYLIVRVTPYEQPGTGTGSILFIGDSTGYGTGASRASESIAGQLGAEYPAYLIKNDSVNGRTIVGALEAAQNLFESSQYDLVVLQIGANDLISGRSASDIVSDMQELIAAVEPHAGHIVIIASGNVGATPVFTGTEAEELTDTSRQFNQQMTALAQGSQTVSFISLFDEPEDDPFVYTDGVYTAIDGLHPTSAGYKVWYDKAKPAFAAVLEQQ